VYGFLPTIYGLVEMWQIYGDMTVGDNIQQLFNNRTMTHSNLQPS